ncbi:glycoside hydrolase family 88 protein [Gynuella sunshinyii]|uniref:Thioredoxin domain-containing protein n=1 Tax=Gynuella sunshinyii YC6258 TaxID=1445510 RepID=A0A0C5VV11_9GAMM|nr:glycoside hydrolase family 88 protein [Gynuella sunshinyii]AJQ97976.1 thioredoxin domain-containing protein [Gynuella sunshinyii YC6258]
MSQHQTSHSTPTASALDRAVNAIRKNLDQVGTRFPKIGAGPGLKYADCDNDDWVEGFWPGQIWLAYSLTQDPVFKDKAILFRHYFQQRLERPEGYIHDFGFMYSLTCVADYQQTGNAEARETALRAARILAGRFNPKGRFIQAWNENDESRQQVYSNRGKMIIDCMENMPLLYWASRETGDSQFSDIAAAHVESTIQHLIRPDYSTGHTFNFNPDSGEPLAITTAQGYADSSCWARGQAWSIHGFCYMFLNTRDQRYLGLACRLADYALERLPANGVPVWDFDLPADQPQYVDSSAAAIYAAGLLLLAELTPAGTPYRKVADTILDTLNREYSLADQPEAEGLLAHGASHVSKGLYDNMLPYGDYFYLEALARQQGHKTFFW